MPELAPFEWREEFAALLEAWETDGGRRRVGACGVALAAAASFALMALGSAYCAAVAATHEGF